MTPDGLGFPSVWQRCNRFNDSLARALESVAAGISRIPGSAIEKQPVNGLTDTLASLREPPPADLKVLSEAAERASEIGWELREEGLVCQCNLSDVRARSLSGRFGQ